MPNVPNGLLCRRSRMDIFCSWMSSTWHVMRSCAALRRPLKGSSMCATMQQPQLSQCEPSYATATSGWWQPRTPALLGSGASVRSCQWSCCRASRSWPLSRCHMRSGCRCALRCACVCSLHGVSYQGKQASRPLASKIAMLPATTRRSVKSDIRVKLPLPVNVVSIRPFMRRLQVVRVKLEDAGVPAAISARLAELAMDVHSAAQRSTSDPTFSEVCHAQHVPCIHMNAC